jgi:glycosyltransferase involved in cell wall biosynthesis
LAPPPDTLHTYFFWPIIYGRILKRVGRARILVENREDTGFKWGRAHHWLLRKVRPNADLVICVSPAVRAAVLSHEPIPSEKVVVVENGVPIPQLVPAHREEARRRLALEPNHVLIGMVANLNLPVKAVDRFIEAMPAILAKAPTARFAIAGDGKLRPALEARAERLGMKERVSFLGHLSSVHTLYRALDISVLTSRSEGLSLSLLESMAYGLPVVVTAVGGNVDVVVDGETGHLVPFGDINAFVAATLNLCADEARRERMGFAGRRLCMLRYDISAVSRRYEAHYGALIGKDA